jgi:hypothetical protein
VSTRALKWKSLFNGKNLKGWNVHGTEKWYVSNEELICESGPEGKYGYLSTVDSYKDFEFKLEFLQEADGNSGIFFRSSLDGTKISGWQAEVAPPGKFTGGIYESSGRGWLIKPDPEKHEPLKMALSVSRVKNGAASQLRKNMRITSLCSSSNGVDKHLIQERIRHVIAVCSYILTGRMGAVRGFGCIL